MTQSLRQRTASGFLWSAAQRVSTLFITFVSSIVLARLLAPADFGHIGMLMVFVAVSGTLIDGGFGAALIQKKEPTSIDYSTVFYFNLVFSIAAYLVLFASAPAIAAMYGFGDLSLMLRVIATVVIINALAIVQTNQLQKHLDFGRLAIVNLIPSAASTVVAIVMAMKGFGPWSLVFRVVLNSAMRSALCWLVSTWKPIRSFSFRAFRELIGFGGLVLLADATETAINQFVSFFIGRSYGAQDLGYYTQATNLQQIPETTIPFVVGQVLFPVFSSIQDRVEAMREAVKESLKALAFVNFPLMVLFMIVAEPLIVGLFTEKWLASVSYFRLLCLGGMLYAANTCNVTVLKALGQGRVFLRVSLLKRGISALAVLIGAQFGIYGIVAGLVASAYLWFPINAYWAGRMIGYGVAAQSRDIYASYVIAVLAGALVHAALVMVRIDSAYLSLASRVVSYTALYAGLSWVFRREDTRKYFALFAQLIRSSMQRSAAAAGGRA